MDTPLMGKRVTVMGLGTRGGGVGVARYLAGQGAAVTVTDAKPAEALAEPLAALAGLPIRYVLGGHDEADFTPAGADLVVRNPGVPRRARLLQLAREHGLPIEMEMSLFLRACPARVIGITGTKGKTSTAALCAAMLREWDDRTILAGNMGVSALGQLERITPETPVVLELSSWQVESLIEHGLAPAIAVLTNISEDHLDHYDGFEDYAATKRGIALHQRPEDVFILNADDPEAWRAAAETTSLVVPFGLRDRGGEGAWRAEDDLLWRWGEREVRVDLPPNPALRGEHGTANALAAAAAAFVRGATPDAVAAGLLGFGGVKDRMEWVGEVGGVSFVNDTTATAPAATLAALRSVKGRRIHLIAGGADKRTALETLAAEAARRAEGVYLLEGSATPALKGLLEREGALPRGPFGSMAAAVKAATEEARPGDLVLLSPGCASFGLFNDEFERGERFRQAVRELDPTAPWTGGGSPEPRLGATTSRSAISAGGRR